jgi:hypothetical protein
MPMLGVLGLALVSGMLVTVLGLMAAMAASQES